MIGMIAPHCLKGARWIQTRRQGSDNDKESGQTRGDIISQIVQPRGELAKVKIPFSAVTDHGVQRVDRFVSDRQRNPAKEKIKERRHDAVAGALG